MLNSVYGNIVDKCRLYSLFGVLWNSLPTPFRIISPQIIKSVSPKLENFPKFEYYSNEREKAEIEGEREIEN